MSEVHAPRSTAQVMRSLVPSVYLPSLLAFSGDAALLPVIPLLALDLGFSVPAAAALTTVFGAFSFLGPIPASRVIDRFGARRSLVLTGTVLVVAGVAAMLVINDGLRDGVEHVHRLALIGALVMMGANTQVWKLGRQAYLGSALPPSMRARGMTLFGGTVRIGQIIGPLLGAVVIGLGHDTWVFGLQAVMTAAATALVAVFLPAGERRGPAVAGHRRRSPRTPARRRLTRGVLARMLSVGLGIAPVMAARVNRPVIVPLMAGAMGVNAFWVSVIFGVSAVVEIALVVPAGTLMDKRGRVAVAVPCSLVLGLGYVLLAVMPLLVGHEGRAAVITALLVPCLVIALGNGLGSGIVMTLGIDVSPVHERTRYLAWWNTLLGGGNFVAPLMVTAITAVAPVAVAGAVTGAMCLGGGTWLARVLPRVRPSGGGRRA